MVSHPHLILRILTSSSPHLVAGEHGAGHDGGGASAADTAVWRDGDKRNRSPSPDGGSDPDGEAGKCTTNPLRLLAMARPVLTERCL